MKALILAAGRGTRLRPVTNRIPKILVPIGGRPLFDHLIALLGKHKIFEAAVNLHHLPEQIIDYLNNKKTPVAFKLLKEKKLLGSAGTARKLKNYFKKTFVVLYGDLLTNINLNKLIDFHRKKRALVTVVLYRVSNPTECGIVKLDRFGKILAFFEKPKPEEVFSNLANAGVYVMEPEVFSYIPGKIPCDFGKDVFPVLLKMDQPVFGYPIKKNEYLLDIGDPKKLRQARKDMKEGRVKI